MSRYRVITIKELLMVVTFLALYAAAYSRGTTLDSRLALATSVTIVFFVSLYARSTFRNAYLITFLSIGLYLLLENVNPYGYVTRFYLWLRWTVLHEGSRYRMHISEVNRYYIFLGSMLVIVPYLLARLWAAICGNDEHAETCRSDYDDVSDRER